MQERGTSRGGVGREEPLAEGVRREEGPVCSRRTPPWGQVRVGEPVSAAGCARLSQDRELYVLFSFSILIFFIFLV